MERQLTVTRSSILLALTGGIEFGLQIVIPMIFVRNLDAASFGQYRLLWLVAGSALAIAPAFMPQSLFYFLPRATQRAQQTVIGNVLAYLVAAGCVVAVVSGQLNPWLPDPVKDLSISTHGMSSVFVGMWIVVSLMTVLPTAEGRVCWQTRSDIGMALLRTFLLGGAAVLTHELRWIVGALLIEASLRIFLLLGYIHSRPGGGQLRWSLGSMKTQLGYSFPFAFGNALFLLRAQSDQWVVASMLPAAQFAVFSVSAVFLPVGSLVRQPINNAMMARLNQAFSENNISECRRLIGKGIGAVTLLLLPIAGLIFSLTGELVNIIYTDRYAAAGIIMRVYLIGIMFSAFSVGHVLTAMNQGGFSAKSNAFFLIVSVMLSVAATWQWGMIGSASGSVVTLVLSEIWSFRKVAATMHLSPYELLPLKFILAPVLGTFIGLAGAELVSELTNISLFSRFLLRIIIFATLFAIGFFIGGGWSQAGVLLKSRP